MLGTSDRPALLFPPASVIICGLRASGLFDDKLPFLECDMLPFTMLAFRKCIPGETTDSCAGVILVAESEEGSEGPNRWVELNLTVANVDSSKSIKLSLSFSEYPSLD